MKKIIFTFLFCFLSCIYAHSQSLTITAVNDTANFCGEPLPDSVGTWFDYVFSGFGNNDSITTIIFWGDGSADSVSSPVNLLDVAGSGYESNMMAWHEYNAYGTYDLTFVVVGPGGISDTMLLPDEIIVSPNCVYLTVITYEDTNGNCVYDTGENPVSTGWEIYQGLTQYIPITWSSFDSLIPVAPGAFYSVQVQPTTGFAFSCPASGIINFTASGDTTLFFALQCSPGIYDHGIAHLSAGVRPQQSRPIYVNAWNHSCNIQNGTYSMTLDTSLTYVSAIPTPASVTGNVITWNHNNLNYQNHVNAVVNVIADSTLGIGDSVCITSDIALVAGDANSANNTFSSCIPVANSFDPNEKFVSPRGIGPLGLIPPLSELYYMVVFQNTGNDTAYNVIVVDTLDTDLDYRSFQVIGASHNYSLRFPSDNVVRFHFDNIYLPDSNVNEAASHGFLIYKISAGSGLAHGTSLTNRAYIYFDNNVPVLTSTTLNTIQISTGIEELHSATTIVYPNPSSDEVHLKSALLGWKYLRLFNLNGQEVYNAQFSNEEHNFSVRKFAHGLYSGTILNEGILYNFKLVVQ